MDDNPMLVLTLLDLDYKNTWAGVTDKLFTELMWISDSWPAAGDFCRSFNRRKHQSAPDENEKLNALNCANEKARADITDLLQLELIVNFANPGVRTVNHRCNQIIFIHPHTLIFTHICSEMLAVWSPAVIKESCVILADWSGQNGVEISKERITFSSDLF